MFCLVPCGSEGYEQMEMENQGAFSLYRIYYNTLYIERNSDKPGFALKITTILYSFILSG